jgi:N-acetylmuramoyl-L-alanine amidase
MGERANGEEVLRITRCASRSTCSWLAVSAGIALALAAATPAGATATLRAVRQITAPASTRLIVEFSQPVQYRLQRIAARPELSVPARLYVEFLDTAPARVLRDGIDFTEGPLLRLRATWLGGAITRLILDVPGLSDFGAFPMPDPFRLIIDVRGTPRAGPVRVVAQAPDPPQRLAAVPRLGAAALPPAPAVPPRRRVKIVLDPGHGGKDPGARSADGAAEKDVVLAIARRLEERLQTVPGVAVVLTRRADVFLALEERTARANAEQADLFVSIHANASADGNLSGVETYFLNNTNDRATIRLAKMENGLRQTTGRGHAEREVALILSDLIQSYKVQESVALAESIQHELVGMLDAQGTPVNDLGVKRGPFYVLVGAGMPCVLVEVSFVSNAQEGRRLAQPAYQDAIAEGLLHGIRRFVDNTRVAENL